jgi:hypothetical protein
MKIYLAGVSSLTTGTNPNFQIIRTARPVLAGIGGLVRDHWRVLPRARASLRENFLVNRARLSEDERQD